MGKARERPTTGRAIASVAPMLPDRQQGKPAETWKLSDHGIAIPGMEQAPLTSGGTLGLLPVADKGDGAFTRMATFLGSGCHPVLNVYNDEKRRLTGDTG